ncbi:protein-tyrosine phosphatase family protein [Ruegeria faecimaris]|uniref:protein-tyrosine phosphatase family protein n=1 Tax=Ruegeria faecimaris TaxID=686389 RepID=UPI003A7F28DA
MLESFAIHPLGLGKGQIALCPLPGVTGDYAGDFAVIRDWAPDLVISMTTSDEFQHSGGLSFEADLQCERIAWVHLPIRDFGVPTPEVEALWPQASEAAQHVLASGGKVLVHCRGGCGRSGMVVMRLMVECGEAPGQALRRLRAVRPCAVETKAQKDWAGLPARTLP